MKKITLFVAAIAVMFTVTIVACKKKESSPMVTPTPSLYDRLGGESAIKAVVDKFIEYVAADTVINGFFAETVAQNRVDILKMNLVNQIGEAGGGPQKYTGKSMPDAHKGMNIQDKHFDALVGDLIMSLDYYKVPEKEKQELLSVLGPMRSDIVGK